MQITQHFSLEELTITQHREIKNVPSEKEINNLTQLAIRLETIRTMLGFPLIISSGFRCLTLNRAIGSKDSSAHTKGLAVDFICPLFGEPKDIFDFIRSHPEIKYDQLILENIGGRKWIHFGIKEDVKEYRQQALLIDDTGTRFA